MAYVLCADCGGEGTIPLIPGADPAWRAPCPAYCDGGVYEIVEANTDALMFSQIVFEAIYGLPF